MQISPCQAISQKLHKYQHEISKRPQHAPYPLAPMKYGATAQEQIKTDESKTAFPERINRVQKIFGSILYYERSVDPTILMALSTLAIEQSKGTAQTIKNLQQLLDYLGTHPYKKNQYYASGMIINIHSYASYLSERDARSRSEGHFFLGRKPQDKHPVHLNGAIFTLCLILNFFVASEAEA